MSGRYVFILVIVSRFTSDESVIELRSTFFQAGITLDYKSSVRVHLMMPLCCLRINGIKGPKAFGIPSFVWPT